MSTHRSLGFALGLSVLGCGTGDTPSDASVPADRQDVTTVDLATTCTNTLPELVAGDANGHAEPLAASAGQSRAGRLRAQNLPTDRTGLALWSAGDFVLANGRIAVMIEDTGPSDLYNPWGGGIVGLARVDGGHLVQAADFNESIIGIGRYTLETSSVRVVRDGSAGGPALVRAVGTFRPIPFIDDFARPVAPAEYTNLRGALEYELGPDADHVDIYVTFSNSEVDTLSVRTVIHAFFQRYRMPMYNPVTGFDGPGFYQPATVGGPARTSPYVAFIDDTAVSYAWSSPDGALTPLLSVSGFDAFTSPRLTIPGCAQTRRHFARVVVGGPGLDGLRVAQARTDHEALREIRATVRDAAGMPAVAVRVHATSPDGALHLTRAVTDAAGACTLHVPMTQSARITGWREGEPVMAPVDVDPSTGTVALAMAPVGSIRVSATEMSSGGVSAPVPARVQVMPAVGEPPALSAMYGERNFAGRRAHIAFPVSGQVTLPVPPGRYLVVVSRGSEYELVSQEVTVTAGATVEALAALRRVVDTPNVMCGDFHIHTNRSPDSGDSARFKLAAAAGDGLEIAARSDHEFVADWSETVRDMGLGQWVFGFPSLELTTFAWGHFGVIPIAPNPAMPNAGIFNWVGRRPPEVFDEVRRHPSHPTLIINHPRGAAAGAYFDAVHYDPATGVAGNADMWDSAFTVVEVFNNSDFEANRDRTVRDWFSFLSHGRRVFAVGSSDSHGVHPNTPVGYPRTCMTFGTNDPRMLTPETVRDSLAQGRSYISGGIYLDVQGPGGMGPGQTVIAAGAEARVRVTVQAPSWVTVDRLDVYVDQGVVRPQQTVMLTQAQRDPTNPVVRFRGEVTVPVAASGSWAVLVASGSGDLAPVHPNKRPFAVSNPIFFQR